MKKFFNKLWFYLTHSKCELCNKWVNETYVFEYYSEAGLMACDKCCAKNKNRNL